MTDGYGEIKFRAQHGDGLTFDKVKTGVRNDTINLRLKDKRHAALEAILIEHSLLDTANKLEEAALLSASGIGYTVQDANKIRGSSTNASEYVAVLIQDYLDWGMRCKEKHLSPLMCRRVVIEGFSLNETDAEFHFREGTAKKNMISCLELFAEMRK
jgi:hypothetical protein